MPGLGPSPPLSAAIEPDEEGAELFHKNVRVVEVASDIVSPALPEWAIPNQILLERDAMLLRDFSKPGHSATIADYQRGQSWVETLLAPDLDHVLVTVARLGCRPS